MVRAWNWRRLAGVLGLALVTTATCDPRFGTFELFRDDDAHFVEDGFFLDPFFVEDVYVDDCFFDCWF